MKPNTRLGSINSSMKLPTCSMKTIAKNTNFKRTYFHCGGKKASFHEIVECLGKKLKLILNKAGIDVERNILILNL